MAKMDKIHSRPISTSFLLLQKFICVISTHYYKAWLIALIIEILYITFVSFFNDNKISSQLVRAFN